MAPSNAVELALVKGGNGVSANGGSNVRSWSERTFSAMAPGSLRSSIFSLCCSAIGMGVMVLPYNMAQVGGPLALVLLAVAAFAALVSLQICCAGMHATRTHSYVDTLTVLFSSRVAAALTGMLVLACFGIICGYFVFASQLIQQLLQIAGAPEILCEQWVVVMLSACMVFPISLYKNLSDFRYLTVVSFTGLTYLTLVVVLRTPSYLGERALVDGWWWRVGNLVELPKCASLCFSAYTVHMNVFACYDELFNPTSGRINKVLRRSIYVQFVLYVSVAMCGFISFGVDTPDNILRAYSLSDTFANVGRLFVSFQLLLAVPLTVHPARLYLWQLLVILMPSLAPTKQPSSQAGKQAASSQAAGAPDTPSQMTPTIHVALSAAVVAGCALVAAKVQSASDILGVVGGFAGVTYTFILPAEIVLKLRANGHRFAVDWTASPAPYIPGRGGKMSVTFLRVCSIVGYVAAAQCFKNMLGDWQLPSDLTFRLRQLGWPVLVCLGGRWLVRSCRSRQYGAELT